MRGWLKVVIWSTLALLLFALVFPRVIEPFLFLLVGWVPFLWNTLPKATENGEVILSGAVFLVLGLVGFHYLAVLVARRRQHGWRWAWSVCLMCMLITVLVVSLAGWGSAHQISRLAKTEKWTDYGRGTAKEIEKARRLMKAIHLFCSDYSGIFPETLDKMLIKRVLEFDQLEELRMTSKGWLEPSEPWIYVLGFTDSSVRGSPILIGPLLKDGSGRVVAFQDASAKYMKEEEFRKMLRQLVRDWYSGPEDEIPPEYKPFLEES